MDWALNFQAFPGCDTHASMILNRSRQCLSAARVRRSVRWYTFKLRQICHNLGTVTDALVNQLRLGNGANSPSTLENGQSRINDSENLISAGGNIAGSKNAASNTKHDCLPASNKSGKGGDISSVKEGISSSSGKPITHECSAGKTVLSSDPPATDGVKPRATPSIPACEHLGTPLSETDHNTDGVDNRHGEVRRRDQVPETSSSFPTVDLCGDGQSCHTKSPYVGLLSAIQGFLNVPGSRAEGEAGVTVTGDDLTLHSSSSLSRMAGGEDGRKSCDNASVVGFSFPTMRDACSSGSVGDERCPSLESDEDGFPTGIWSWSSASASADTTSHPKSSKERAVRGNGDGLPDGLPNQEAFAACRVTDDDISVDDGNNSGPETGERAPSMRPRIPERCLGVRERLKKLNKRVSGGPISLSMVKKLRYRLHSSSWRPRHHASRSSIRATTCPRFTSMRAILPANRTLWGEETPHSCGIIPPKGVCLRLPVPCRRYMSPGHHSRCDLFFYSRLENTTSHSDRVTVQLPGICLVHPLQCA